MTEGLAALDTQAFLAQPRVQIGLGLDLWYDKSASPPVNSTSATVRWLNPLTAKGSQRVIRRGWNKAALLPPVVGPGGNMDRKVIAIIVTVVAVLLCACPGLFGLFMGGMFAVVSFMPGADIDMFGSSDPQSALTFGIGGLCGGIVLLLIAAVAIFIVWRRKGDAAT
jgi:hypothetical protein